MEDTPGEPGHGQFQDGHRDRGHPEADRGAQEGGEARAPGAHPKDLADPTAGPARQAHREEEEQARGGESQEDQRVGRAGRHAPRPQDAQEAEGNPQEQVQNRVDEEGNEDLAYPAGRDRWLWPWEDLC